MSEPSESGDRYAWRIAWGASRTRLRILVFAVGAGLATVTGSLLGLYPEALVFQGLTRNGVLDTDGWGATFVGNVVQMVSVLLALFIFARLVRWATPQLAEIENLDVLDMHESLRRTGRTALIFPLLGAVAVISQIIIWVAEESAATRMGWADGSFIELSRLPAAAFLALAATGLTETLRRMLAERD